jgi:hypothetical protein
MKLPWVIYGFSCVSIATSITIANICTIQSRDRKEYYRKVAYALVKGVMYGILWPISSPIVISAYLAGGDMTTHTSLGPTG